MIALVLGYVAMFIAGGIAVTVAALLYLDYLKKRPVEPVETLDEWLDRQW